MTYPGKKAQIEKNSWYTHKHQHIQGTQHKISTLGNHTILFTNINFDLERVTTISTLIQTITK